MIDLKRLNALEKNELEHLSTDGIGGTLRNIINQFSEDEFIK